MATDHFLRFVPANCKVCHSDIACYYRVMQALAVLGVCIFERNKDYDEDFSDQGTVPMTIDISISSGFIDINGITDKKVWC